MNQVHGAHCVRVDVPGEAADCDGMVTRRPGLGLSVRTADCLPVVLTSEKEAAVCHAGWRGLVKGILESTVALMHSSPKAAFVGPAIGPCCFEVGSEVADQFPDPHVIRRQGKRSRVDLAAAAESRLRTLGVPIVDRSRICTRCNQHLLPSYRGSGGAPGRLVTVAWRTE